MPSRRGVAVAAAGVVVLVSATAFLVRARQDLHSTQRARSATTERLTTLDSELRTATVRRADETRALATTRALLDEHTSIRDDLRATGRVEYQRLVAALDDLTRRRVAVTADTQRAKRLDDCLLGASQVLNEVAVGDTAHLATTLPVAQQLCEQVAA